MAKANIPMAVAMRSPAGAASPQSAYITQIPDAIPSPPHFGTGNHCNLQERQHVPWKNVDNSISEWHRGRKINSEISRTIRIAPTTLDWTLLDLRSPSGGKGARLHATLDMHPQLKIGSST